MNKFKQGLTAAVATGVVAGVGLFAPQAMAAESTEMELRILQMEETLRMMRGELEVVRSENLGGRFDALEERVGAVDMGDFMKKGGSTIFFKGGFSRMTGASRADESFSDAWGNGSRLNDGKEGYHFGAGIEHTLSEDLFGLMDGVDLLGEISFQVTRWSSKNNGEDGSLRVVPAVGFYGVGGGSSNTNATDGTGVLNGESADNLYGVTLSTFTLSAAPKLKFPGFAMAGFTPYVIPAGFDIHVISPPSDAATVMIKGIQFGGGLEYDVISTITAGMDARYHWSQQIDGSDPRYFQVGGYLGFKF